LRVAATFLGWTCLLPVFRSATLGSAATFLGRMFSFAGGRSEPFNLTCVGLLAGLVAAGYFAAARGRRLPWRVPAAAQGLAYAGAMTAALVLTPGAGKAFIYFQF
jgi:alginate O-acetyltransferase complex protein AlgI